MGAGDGEGAVKDEAWHAADALAMGVAEHLAQGWHIVFFVEELGDFAGFHPHFDPDIDECGDFADIFAFLEIGAINGVKNLALRAMAGGVEDQAVSIQAVGRIANGIKIESQIFDLTGSNNGA